MPTAAASTGTRKLERRAASTSSSTMMATPMTPPNSTIGHGNWPPNSPFATEAIRVACGASSGWGCARLGTPIP